MLLPHDPKEIGGIQILDRLGSGGAGIVYKGRDKDNQIVALKVLHAEFANNQTVRKRLEREADAMRSVKGNRTVKVRRIEIDVVQPFIVMDFAEGENLANYIANNGVLKGQALNDFAVQLAEAIRDIHKAKVIHRDLKPTNVIIGPDGLKVVDFGISIVSEVTGMTQTGLMVGTVSWLSPEQILGKEITQKTDIFNYGLVLGFAATGKHPFGEGKPEAVMFRILNSDPELNNIKNEYKIEIVKYLEKNPDRRINSLAIFGSKDNLQSISIRQFVVFHKYKKVLFALGVLTVLLPVLINFNFKSNTDEGKIKTAVNNNLVEESEIINSPMIVPSLSAKPLDAESIKNSQRLESNKVEDSDSVESIQNNVVEKTPVQNQGQICFEKTQELKISKKCKSVKNKDEYFGDRRTLDPLDPWDEWGKYFKAIMWSDWLGEPMCLNKNSRYTVFHTINGTVVNRLEANATLISNPNIFESNFCKDDFNPDYLDTTIGVPFDADAKGKQISLMEVRSINENPIIVKVTWSPS
jgi:serine/threonine protein kinase